MPVTAKLSRRFYEKLGDEVTNELVDWLNAVDASYRAEFRDLFEAHFSRFESRLAEDHARLSAELRQEMITATADLRDRINASEKSLIRWMFGFWIGSGAALVGLLLALRQLGMLGNP